MLDGRMEVLAMQWVGRALWTALAWAACGAACFSSGNDWKQGAELPDGGQASDASAAETVSTTEPATNVCAADKPCTGASTTCASAVCVATPPAGVVSTITNPVGDLPTLEAPNLACVGQPAETPAGPATATLYGAVARFGSGVNTEDVEVNVYLAETFDPSACESKTSASALKDCYDAYGTPLASVVSGPAPLLVPLPGNCASHAECPLGYRCIEGDLDYACEEQYGVYEIPSVPLNTALIFRARGTTAYHWHTTYVFNVYLYADNLEADGRYHYDATIVSHGQWLLTPNTVGLPAVPEDRGVVGGRVRDCRVAGTRDSWAVAEVSLGLARPAHKFVFFNDLEDDTVPLPDEKATDILGRFAALDVGIGWNSLAGVVRIGAETTTIGAVPVYVFPDALTVLSFPGQQPAWSQK